MNKQLQEKRNINHFYNDATKLPYYVDNEPTKVTPITPIKDVELNPNKLMYRHHENKYHVNNEPTHTKNTPITPIEDVEFNPNKLMYRHRNVNKVSVVAGLDNMRPLDERSCLNDVLRANSSLSSPVQCARTCTRDDRRICYYNFIVENYQVNGL